MHANDTNGNINGLIQPKLSYLITGVCFDTHNTLGRFARERQYCDFIERRLNEAKIPYKREFNIKESGNFFDFLIDEKVVLEIKAKKIISKDDYYQVQRYLQMSGVKLGLLVNFRNRYIKPIRIIKIDTKAKSRFV